jgi:hypothetical protein
MDPAALATGIVFAVEILGGKQMQKQAGRGSRGRYNCYVIAGECLLKAVLRLRSPILREPLAASRTSR